MSDITDIKPIEVISKEVSRRNFIKGVIASGAAVSSANYLFRAATLFGQTPGASGTERLITINVNGQQRRVDVLKAGNARVDVCVTSWALRARNWAAIAPSAARALS